MKACILCFIHFFVLLSRTVPGMEQMLSKCLLNERTNKLVMEMYVHPLLKEIAGPNIWLFYSIS